MLNFIEKDGNYQINVTERDLTICDPCCPNDGEAIRLALGQWQLCPIYRESCFGSIIDGWQLTNLAAAVADAYPETYFVGTDTGLVALVEDNFSWSERKKDILTFRDVAGAGQDWLALCTGGDGTFRVTVDFNEYGEAVAINIPADFWI